jgi:hypothetical protein
MFDNVLDDPKIKIVYFLYSSLMTRINGINNRIEGHIFICDGEITADGITLGFDERMNTIPSKF